MDTGVSQRKQVKFLKNVCCVPQRYILCFMGFLSIVTAYLLRLSLNVAITEMVYHNATNNTGGTSDDTCPDPNKNVTQKWVQKSAEVFDWDEATQGLILSAFYWGYVITHLPGGIMADKCGGKYTLGLGIMLSSFFTLFVPAAARLGYPYLLCVRVFTGLGEGTTFPALSDLLARWVPLEERSFLGSLAYSGSLMGTVIGTLLTGFLLDKYEGDWPLVFYVMGTIGFVWCILWCILCYSTPDSHPWIRDTEKEYLDRTVPKKKYGAVPPYKHILRSGPVWALVAAQIGHDWGFFIMVTDLPKYMKDVLKFSIRENAILSSIPYVFMWIVSLSTGILADYLIRNKHLSVGATRKIFTSIAHFGPAVGLVAASYAGCNRTLVVVLFTITMGLMGTFYPGMRVNSLDLSPNYVGTLMALVNGIGAFVGVFTPYLVGILTPDRKLSQWRKVFWIASIVNVVTIFIFVAFGSGKVQSWNYIGFDPPTEEELKNMDPPKRT